MDNSNIIEKKRNSVSITLSEQNLETCLTCLQNDTRRLKNLLSKSRCVKDSNIISQIIKGRNDAEKEVKKILNTIYRFK
jgi:hypothetical protein